MRRLPSHAGKSALGKKLGPASIHVRCNRGRSRDALRELEYSALPMIFRLVEIGNVERATTPQYPCGFFDDAELFCRLIAPSRRPWDLSPAL
jgi:hypothetical protein